MYSTDYIKKIHVKTGYRTRYRILQRTSYPKWLRVMGPKRVMGRKRLGILGRYHDQIPQMAARVRFVLN